MKGKGVPQAPTIRKVLASQVRIRMASLCVSVTDIAARAGCSRGTLHAILRGDVIVGLSRVSALASVLESSAAHLLDAGVPHALLGAEPMRDISLVLARNVIHWRARKSFVSLEALACAASISKSHLYMIVAARCDIGIDHVAKLGHALSVSPSCLVCERVEGVEAC